MYKSSKNTYAYKYMFFPLLLAIFVYLDVSALRQENVWQYYWTNFPAPMSWWATAWFLILILRIRHVHADESGITIFSLSGNKTLAYRNVEYVSEIALTSPGRFSLKYTDPQTMRAKKSWSSRRKPRRWQTSSGNTSAGKIPNTHRPSNRRAGAPCDWPSSPRSRSWSTAW